MATFFADYFGIAEATMNEYGALNVSIVNDLPLFIDPFLPFHSNKDEYRRIHDDIIKYLIFLRTRSQQGRVSDERLRVWYCFPGVKQNWLGFSVVGNGGSGLGINFAKALHDSLHVIFSDFGDEKISQGSHIEKVCLIRDGIGRDNISDFTTNLSLDFHCTFTETFFERHLDASSIRSVSVNRAKFNYETEAWERKLYRLPWINNDYVILTPKDILTRDENWLIATISSETLTIFLCLSQIPT
jgi:hypothetical protein